ncbi:N-terminal acetyltransferase [Podila epigama]|nr:N-terminal acetyltransferase [Podila epigama]
MTASTKQVKHYTKDQIFAILRHIKFPLKDPNVLPEPTLETLRELEYRCITTIPFETLSLRTTESRAVDITPEGIYDRVVNKKRGGWCFSLNYLAFEILYGLGYTVQFTLARVCKPERYGDPIIYGGLTHRVSIVKFEDGTKYLFDIGFGATSFEPIKLEDGHEVEYYGHRRRLHKVHHNETRGNVLGNPPEEFWEVLEYMGKTEAGEEKWAPGYAFTEREFFDSDCEVGNFFCAFSPTSPFRNQFWVIRGTLDGHYNILINNDFKVRSATGTVKSITIESEEHRLEILKEYYGIVLTEDELKYHDLKIVPSSQ